MGSSRGRNLIETSLLQTHKSRSVNLKRSIGEARVPWLFIPRFMSEIATLRAKIRFLRRRVYSIYKPGLEESKRTNGARCNVLFLVIFLNNTSSECKAN